MGNQIDPFDMYDHDVKLKWTASTSDTKDEIDQLKDIEKNNEAFKAIALVSRRIAELENENHYLKVENAKLREEAERARDPQRIGGQADPSSFIYAIEQLREFRWQHATNDEDAIPYINNVAAAHERENAKLRELVRDMWKYTYIGADCDGHTLYDRTRELGIEVDE